jgi:DNA (cytosine-5)-methyltransferase 1
MHKGPRGTEGVESNHIVSVPQPYSIAFSAKDYGGDATEEMSPTLRAGGHSGSHANAGVMPAVAFHNRQDPDVSGDVTHPIGAKDNGLGVSCGAAVRRLTPVECERLQGFPDNFTAIPWKKKDADNCPDGPRYKALGNSMAVPVMRWIGERIQLVDDLTSLL